MEASLRVRPPPRVRAWQSQRQGRGASGTPFPASGSPGSWARLLQGRDRAPGRLDSGALSDAPAAHLRPPSPRGEAETSLLGGTEPAC